MSCGAVLIPGVTPPKSSGLPWPLAVKDEGEKSLHTENWERRLYVERGWHYKTC